MKSWTLKNGAQLFYEPNGLPYITSIAVEIERGSFKEPVHGIAHLDEHLVCTDAGFSFNAEETERTGDVLEHFNASTGLTQTIYSLGALNEDFLRVSSRLINSVFQKSTSEQTLDDEKKTVVREIAEHNRAKTPENLAGIKLGSTFFGSDWYEYQGLGTKESVLATSLADVNKFRTENYIPANAKIFVAGQIRRGDFEALLAHIEAIPRGAMLPVIEHVPVSLPRAAISLEAQVTGDPSVAYLQLAFEKPNAVRTDGNAYGIIQRSLLGSDGRLMTLFRNKLRATYSMSANQISFANAQGQYVLIPCTPENLEQTRDLLFAEFDNIKTEGLRDTELTRIQKQLRIESVAKRNSSNWDIINDMVASVRYGTNNKQYLAQLGKVKQDEIIHTARRYLPSIESPYVMQIVRQQ